MTKSIIVVNYHKGLNFLGIADLSLGFLRQDCICLAFNLHVWIGVGSPVVLLSNIAIT